MARLSSRDSYWNLYCYLVYKMYYYDEYMKKSSFYDKCLNALIAIASSTSITSWLVWQKFEVFWAIIVGLAQLFSLIKPLFHFSEHICLISILLPELNKVVADMGRQLDSFSKKTSEKSIVDAMGKAEKRFNELEARYIASMDFPTRKKCQDIAEKYRDDYLAARHGVLQREEITV